MVVVLAVLLTAVVRTSVVTSAYVSGNSMQPDLRPADRVLVLRLGSVSRGDIVVANVADAFDGPDRTAYQSPGSIGRVLAEVSHAMGLDLGEKDVIARVAAVAGDRVETSPDGSIRVNGREATWAVPVAAEGPYAHAQAGHEASFTVPAGRIWLLGGTEGVVADSRAHVTGVDHGTVAADDVIGRVLFRYWPLTSRPDPQPDKALSVQVRS